MDASGAAAAGMGIGAVLMMILLFAVSIASLVCFVLVLIQMFQRGEQTIGIVCIVLTFCSGLGTLVAFIYGWVKATEWNLKKVMLAWTGLFVANLVLAILYVVLVIGAMAGAAATSSHMSDKPEWDSGLKMVPVEDPSDK